MPRDNRAGSVEGKWSDQAVAELGDEPIKPGVNYLKTDFTAIDVPDHLVACWAPEDEDLSNRGYFKADPQPKNHTMVRRWKNTLWLTRRDMYETQKEAEREYFNARYRAADSSDDIGHGATVLRREGRESMAEG